MYANITDNIASFIEQVDEVQDTDQLDLAMMSHFKDIGVKMCSYRHLPPLGVKDYENDRIVSNFGFPPSLSESRGGNKFCEYDPIFMPTVKQNRPVTWSTLIKRNNTAHEMESCISEVKKLGVNSGVALPVYGAYSRGAVFSLGFDFKYEELTHSEVSLLQWSCQVIHSQYIALLEKEFKKDFHFTAREHDIFKWMVRGKSNPEIGTILDISPHTVNTYIRRIYLKLDVYDRVSASLRAISLGLV